MACRVKVIRFDRDEHGGIIEFTVVASEQLPDCQQAQSWACADCIQRDPSQGAGRSTYVYDIDDRDADVRQIKEPNGPPRR